MLQDQAAVRTATNYAAARFVYIAINKEKRLLVFIADIMIYLAVSYERSIALMRGALHL